MKSTIAIITGVVFIAACNTSGGRNTAADSLGNKIIDSTGRKDTMYYERLQHKTGSEDSTTNPSVRKDTGYYERLPQKIHPPDSSE